MAKRSDTTLPLPGVRFEGHCAGCQRYPVIISWVRQYVYRCDDCRATEAET